MALHLVMVLVCEVEESGDVKAQLRHILQEQQHQTHTGQTTGEGERERGRQRGREIDRNQPSSFLSLM